MGSYKQYITNAGENMTAQALRGGNLEFTRVIASSAEIIGTEEQIRALTDLSDIKKTIIPEAATASGNAIRVQSSFTNEDVTEPYLVQAVGLYARIGDNPEILFDIAVAEDPSKMTVPSTQSVGTLEFNFNIEVQQADQITITVAPGGRLPSEVFYQTFPGLKAPSKDDVGKTVTINSEGKAVWGQSKDIREQIDNFHAARTVFNPDESITEIDASGNTKHTVFEQDGSITETLKDPDGKVIATKTTTFNADGSIDEEVS